MTAVASPYARLVLLGLFFGSGFAGLVYEVLWLRQLALLFGSTAQATATTLAVFFAGLSIGSRLWGRHARSAKRPLRTYAWLEIAIAVSAMAYFVLLDAYHAVYPWLFSQFAPHPVVFVAVKAMLAAVALLPPAIFMGGTLPLMGQHLIRNAGDLGRTASLLYAINTLGAGVGAFAAGFFLPRALGVTAAYLVPIVLNLAIGLVAFAMSPRHDEGSPSGVVAEDEALVRAAATPSPVAVLSLPAIAFASGFTALGLEVLWTRMFAQVLQNSTYSFSAILVTFLCALGFGAVLVQRLCRLDTARFTILYWICIAAGMATAATPFLFVALTDDLGYVALNASFGAYVASIFGLAAATILIPGALAGAILPYVVKCAEREADAPGAIIGRMTAVNTAGAIVGSLTTGFLLIDALGLWASIRTLALVYLLLAIYVAHHAADVASTKSFGRGRAIALPIAILLVLVTFLDPSRIPVVRVETTRGESLLETWETSHGIVSVVRDQEGLRVKVDNYYSLGGTAARTYEETQADVPIVLHENPKSVFFLGLGSGISAGAAMRHPVERVTVAELTPEVITASRKYFGAYLNGLFEDKRARVVAEDGRNYLAGTRDDYDVIIADLFIPWRAGAANLYTREHFEIVRSRLKPGGLFAQWIPMYQVSRREMFTITRTLMDVFPQVTLWRGDFLAERPIMALIAQDSEAVLQPEAIVRNFRARRANDSLDRRSVMGLISLFYAGNLTASAHLFRDAPANTDDRPIIEYAAPVTHREQWAGNVSWLTKDELAGLLTTVSERVPPASDPYLARLTEEEKRFVAGGRTLHLAKISNHAGDEEATRELVERFTELVPVEIARAFADRVNEKEPGADESGAH